MKTLKQILGEAKGEWKRKVRLKPGQTTSRDVKAAKELAHPPLPIGKQKAKERDEKRREKRNQKARQRLQRKISTATQKLSQQTGMSIDDMIAIIRRK